jgi:hypothetical protein
VDDLFSPRCFACQFFPYGESRLKNPRKGWSKRLQRCHIIAHSIGGYFAPGNFLMLCQRCHHEAPMTRDPQVMLSWAKNHESFLSVVFGEYRRAIEDANLLAVSHLWRDSDRVGLVQYMRSLRLDFHPRSTHLDRFRQMAVLTRDYLQARQFEQSELFQSHASSKVFLTHREYPHVWAWGPGKIGRMPGRKGQRCRVLARGSRNSCWVEFEDGAQFVTSRNGIRKAKP